MTVCPITPLAQRDTFSRPEWVWAIDPSATKGAAFAFLNLNTGKHQTHIVPWANHKDTGRRLMECHAEVSQWSRAMVEHFTPLTVCMERAVYQGRPNLSLCEHMGAIRAAVGIATGLPVWFTSTSQWRAHTGARDKAGVIAWAEGQGWHGGTDDEAEALAMAFYAAGEWQELKVA